MISVVIPTHNRLGDLKRALNSVYKQTILPGEIIVVDDGSYPAVPENIFNNAPVSVNYVLLRNKESKGGNFTRNRGAAAASGEYIAFLDDDDEFADTKVNDVNNLILAEGGVDLIYHPAEVYMINQGLKYISKPKKFSQNDNVFDALLLGNHIGGTSMVILRKDALIDVGFFDVTMPALQDYELWLRFAKKNRKFVMLDKPLTKYYVVSKSKTVTTNVDLSYKAISLINKKFENDYIKLSPALHRERDNRIQKMYVYKSILSGEKCKALRLQFFLIIRDPTLKNVLYFLVMALNINLIFKMRSLIK